jgi:predicted ATPase
MATIKSIAALPQIESLRVQNYRALKDIELKNLTRLTVLLGANGSGKTTVFDVFSFLAECFNFGLRSAWDKRNRFKELRTRGVTEPITIEIRYREKKSSPLITYHLAIDETPKGPVVVEEWLRWQRKKPAYPFKFLDYKYGKGTAITGEMPEADDKRISYDLKSPDLLAVNTLGQLQDNPRVAALREFITGWYISYLTPDAARGYPDAGPQEKLSRTGDNLPNVIQYLQEQYPEQLERILTTLTRRVPQLQKVFSEPMPSGHLLLRIKDAPFEDPILAKFASDGTLKMLAYLIVLYDPAPSPFIGLEEPENQLHPRLLYELGEECRSATARTQMLVTTHSPFFLNAMQPEEVRILFRDELGFTQTKQVSTIQGIQEFVNEGATLGNLWMENQFGVGDPLTRPEMTRSR